MMRNYLRILAIVISLACLWLWANAPRPVGPFSASSDGKTNVSLGPFVNTVDPKTDAANHCQSDGWTRACYQSQNEIANVRSSEQKPYSAPSCPNPAQIIGTFDGKPRVVYLVDRASLVVLSDLYPGFKPLEIRTGTCPLLIYKTQPNSKFELLTSVPPRREISFSKVPTDIAAFQK